MYIAQAKPVRDEFPQWVVFHVTHHLPHARSVGRRLFAAHTEHARVLRAEMPMRTYRDFAQIRKIAGFHEQSANAQHFERFWHSLRNSSAFDHHVSAAAAV